MKNLIAAFAIFNKYIPDEEFPIGAEHDELYVYCSPELVSEEDKAKLEELGFHSDENFACFSRNT